MNWTTLDTWIAVIGALSCASCGLLGSYLVLRRMSMMGDAISHAVLPGLAAAFLLTSSRDSLTMFIGAAVAGVLTAVFVQWVHHLGGVEQSASMGVVFTTLFAIGLILIVRGADAVDLDPGCVLYGAIELAPMNTVDLIGRQVPQAAVTLATVLMLNVGVVLLLYKELEISAFDPALAATLGIPAGAMHYVLMALVAVTTVASFEAVGSILVIAMLIVPAAAAHLLTDRLSAMLIVSVVMAAVSAPLGHLAAITVPGLFGYADTSTAGMMAVTAGGMFFVSLLAAPRHGVLSKAVARARLVLSIAQEDILGMLYRLEELRVPDAERPCFRRMVSLLEIRPATRRLALALLRRRGKILRVDDRWELTDGGRRAARRLVRSHRLWEAYLHRHLNVAPEKVHTPAHRLEHVTDESMRGRLAARTDAASRDPHGAPIPPEGAGHAEGSELGPPLTPRSAR